MCQVIKKTWKFTPFLRIRLLFDPQQCMLSQYFRTMFRHADLPSSLVLVRCAENLFYFGLIGQIVSSLRMQQPIRIEQFVLRSLNVDESKFLGTFIRSRMVNVVHNHKWTHLYNAFCDGICYRSTTFCPIDDAVDLHPSWMCWRNLSDKKKLIELVIDGVVIGDLVNDSFLRFKPAPTVNLKSIYLWALLWQAYRDARRAQEYFKNTKPALYLTYQTLYSMWLSALDKAGRKEAGNGVG